MPFFEFFAKIWKFIKGLIHTLFFLAKIWKNLKGVVHAFLIFSQNLENHKGVSPTSFEFLAKKNKAWTNPFTIFQILTQN